MCHWNVATFRQEIHSKLLLMSGSPLVQLAPLLTEPWHFMGIGECMCWIFCMRASQLGFSVGTPSTWGYQCKFIFNHFKYKVFNKSYHGVQCFPNTNMNYTLVESILSFMLVVHWYQWPRLLPSLQRLFQARYLTTLSAADYMGLATDEQKSTVHWQTDTDRGKLKYLEENLSVCHCVCYKSHMDWPGI